MTKKDKLKYTLKVIIAYSLYFTGILHLFKIVWLRNKAIVLMYHRVLSESDKRKSFSHDGIIVDKDTFEKHMRFLKKEFNVVSLSEFNNRIQNQLSFNKYSCLITFDDGWSDNYAHAYPILMRYKLPAVIFLPTGYIGSEKQFWQEKLSRIIYWIYCNADNYNPELLDKYDLRDILKLPDGESKLYIKEYVNRKKENTLHDIEKIISDIFKDIEPPVSVANDNVDNFLNWEQVKHMAMNGISFGSHGVNHKILTKVSLDEVSEEINNSNKEIENNLGECSTAFSYPNGDYDEDIANMVEKCGYQSVFSTENGLVSPSDSPFTIKRINVHNDVTKNIPLFLTRILGIF